MRKLLSLAFVCVLAILAASPLWAGPDPCEEQCNIDYWTCSDNCGPFGGPLCEEQCVLGWYACLGRC